VSRVQPSPPLIHSDPGRHVRVVTASLIRARSATPPPPYPFATAAPSPHARAPTSAGRVGVIVATRLPGYQALCGRRRTTDPRAPSVSARVARGGDGTEGCARARARACVCVCVCVCGSKGGVRIDFGSPRLRPCRRSARGTARNNAGTYVRARVNRNRRPADRIQPVPGVGNPVMIDRYVRGPCRYISRFGRQNVSGQRENATVFR